MHNYCFGQKGRRQKMFCDYVPQLLLSVRFHAKIVIALIITVVIIAIFHQIRDQGRGRHRDSEDRGSPLPLQLLWGR